MNILFLFRESGPSYVNAGWMNALAYCGHNVRYWHRRHQSAFDAFGEFTPDLYVGTTWDADEALLKLCKKYPQMRVVLYAGTWGDLADGLDPSEYPIVKAGDKEKALLERMKRETGKPDFVWLHVTPEWLEPTLGGYRSVGILPTGITNGADLLTYCGGEYRPEYDSDLTFIGGNWGYKGRMINPYLGPLLHPASGLRAKIWGWSPWPHACYLGKIEESEAKHAFRSAKVCPSIGEPHSLIFSDIVERHYKTIAAGGFCVGGPEVGVEEEFGKGVIPQGKTPEEYHALVRHFVNSPRERAALAAKQYETVLSGHSYFDRVRTVFELVGLPGEARGIAAGKANFLKGLEGPAPVA